MRNPLLMQTHPERVFASLTGTEQMDARLFIGHTNMFVGEYQHPVH